MKIRILNIFFIAIIISFLFPISAFAEINNISDTTIKTKENKTITISTEKEFNDIIAELNTSSSETTIILENDITIGNKLNITNGILNILGNGHTLTVNYIDVRGNATINLGKKDGSDKLTLTTHNKSYCLIDLYLSSTLNMYNGVTIKDSEGFGQGGAIQLNNQSTFNMYGGSIINCLSHSVAGGVTISNYATFNMYDGIIENCSGPFGGGIGFGINAIASDMSGTASFNMYGGKITNCSSIDNYYGYGGGIFIYHANVMIQDGEISKNSANYGGGIIAFESNVTIADSIKLYNNTAKNAGDDIYSNGDNISLVIGEVGNNLKLSNSNQTIDGWYYDNEDNRYDYSKSETINPYPNVGNSDTSEFGLKAAHGLYIPVTGIELNKTQETVEFKDKTTTLTHIINPEAATNKNVIWSSSNPDIATVKDGVVTFLKTGVVTITVTTEDGGYTASATINIKCSHQNIIHYPEEVSTCIKHGHTAYDFCEDCGKIINGSNTKLPLTNHTFGNWLIIKHPTAIEDGLKQRICNICGHKETIIIPAFGATANYTQYTNPQTGDTSNIALWSILMFTSILVLGTISIHNMRKSIK